MMIIFVYNPNNHIRERPFQGGVPVTFKLFNGNSYTESHSYDVDVKRATLYFYFSLHKYFIF